jgi:hypothetical protein
VLKSLPIICSYSIWKVWTVNLEAKSYCFWWNTSYMHESKLSLYEYVKIYIPRDSLTDWCKWLLTYDFWFLMLVHLCKFPPV